MVSGQKYKGAIMNNTAINKAYNKNQIQYTNKNIFEIIRDRISSGNIGSTVFVPHVCNNADAFGAGFAAQVAEKYPIVKADYHMLGKTFLKNNLGHAQVIKVFEDEKYRHKLYFVNMIAQNGLISKSNPRPINYAALVKSMANLSSFIHSNTGFVNNTENIEIHCPKFGSGLAGGNWNFIANLIEDIWLSKYRVMVYEYNKKR